MPISIYMDRREGEQLKELLEDFGADVESTVLTVGDFIVSERTVIERKTRRDFETSIIDGRLFEQLKRLTETFDRVVVLVEGTEDEGRIDKKALMGAYASVITDYGSSLIFTADEKKSTEMIFSIAKHEQIAKKNLVRVKARKKTFTLGESHRAVIEALPLVGPQLAIDLLEHFGTIENVLNASEKELTQVKNLGKKKAKLIKNILQSVYSEE